MKKLLIAILFLLPVMVGFSIRTHGWITGKAFESLPQLMDAFTQRFHQPVMSGLPPRYMLPDLHEPGHANEILADNATRHYDELVSALKNEDWEPAEIELGYLAHYCGDAASPTQNSEQTWGLIDDRYDIVIDLYIDNFVFDADVPKPVLIADIRQYFLDRCKQSATKVDSLIIFHNAVETNQQLWEASRTIFQRQLELAVYDLINVIYTAWDNAGRPSEFSGPTGGGCYNVPVLVGEY